MRIITIGSCLSFLLIAITAGAQVPDVHTPPVPQQVQQPAQQTQQNANQKIQKVNTQIQQDATKTQQTVAAKAPAGASFLQKAEQEVSKIAEKVKDLTPDQKAKLKDLFVSIFQKKAENKAAAGGDADKLKQLNSGIAKMKSDGLKSILNSSQMAALKAAVAKKIGQ